jgi:acyl transferase domain-containing protein
MLALERLSDARRNGRRVLAVIRGSAINQDGASNGLTAPNGPSQERLIRQALADAGLRAADVDAVEAHGTGTALGDPIEAGAILATYGQGREVPLWLGSLKSNIGHAQAAAGVGGVIKTVMAMRKGVLPKTLHAERPASGINWADGKVELLSEALPWQVEGRPRRAGVSSFGASGTNAHLILEQATESVAAEEGGADAPREAALRGPKLFPLSAKSEPALRQQAGRLTAFIDASPELDLADLAHSLATTRTSLEQRAVPVAATREELLDALRALGHGEAAPALARGRRAVGAKVAFVFPGQGSQWQGMALELIEESPLFARHMAECEEALAPHLDFDLRGVLEGAEGAPPIERIEVVQPALFATMVSLARLWRGCGVAPAAVVGHSQGEIAAAHIAGGLSLSDAAMLAAVRSRLIAKLAGKGGLASVGLGAGRIDSLLEAWDGEVTVAARNGPSSTIVSGPRTALDQLLARCAE